MKFGFERRGVKSKPMNVVKVVQDVFYEAFFVADLNGGEKKAEVLKC